ncbi:uncharacterized protein V6R79_013778 [Siganus canaliculatus]
MTVIAECHGSEQLTEQQKCESELQREGAPSGSRPRPVCSLYILKLSKDTQMNSSAQLSAVTEDYEIHISTLYALMLITVYAYVYSYDAQIVSKPTEDPAKLALSGAAEGYGTVGHFVGRLKGVDSQTRKHLPLKLPNGRQRTEQREAADELQTHSAGSMTPAHSLIKNTEKRPGSDSISALWRA